MNYGSIITEITDEIYGETTPPSFITAKLYGIEGIIAKNRKLIQDFNYWFMEKKRRFPIADGKASYTLNINLKEEIDIKFEDYATGDYHVPLEKISLNDIDYCYTDIDDEEEYPVNYYIDYNDDLDLRRITFYKKPCNTNYSTVLSVGVVPEKIANTSFTYQIGGTAYTKAAAESIFSSGDIISAGTWGAWLIEIDSAGTITTSPAGGLTTQSYASEEEALSNLPEPTQHPMGFMAIEAGGLDWMANIDDLTEGSNCNSCNFYNTSIIAELRYWKYFDDLSSNDGDFDITEDEISIQCIELLKWLCIRNIVRINKDWEYYKIAESEIKIQWDILNRRNFSYRIANVQRIPYKRL